LIIRSKAPFRLDLGGGGTDVAPYSEQRGGIVFNTTIDQYAYVTVVPREDGEFTVESQDYNVIARFRGEEDLAYDGNLDLVKATIKTMLERDALIKMGCEIFIHSDVPAGSGLGSSSTVCVALVGALAEYYRIPYTSYEIAYLAYHIEREDLGIKGGYQDQFAAVFGGFNLMEFGKNGSVIVNPLRIKQDILNELHYHLVLAYSGKSRLSDRILDKQINRYVASPKEIGQIYDNLRDYARQMKDAVITGNLDEFAALITKAFQEKKKAVEGLTTDLVDKIYDTAMEHGAIGGRIMGAGGGGHLLFYVDYKRKREVINALTDIGAEVKNFQFEQNGLQTWIQK